MIINNPHFLRSNDSYYCYHFKDTLGPSLVIFDSKSSAANFKNKVAPIISPNKCKVVTQNDRSKVIFDKQKSKSIFLEICDLYASDVQEFDFIKTNINYFVYFDFEEFKDTVVIDGISIDVDYENNVDNYQFIIANYLETNLKLKYNNDRP